MIGIKIKMECLEILSAKSIFLHNVFQCISGLLCSYYFSFKVHLYLFYFINLLFQINYLFLNIYIYIFHLYNININIYFIFPKTYTYHSSWYNFENICQNFSEFLLILFIYLYFLFFLPWSTSLHIFLYVSCQTGKENAVVLHMI